MQTRDLKDKVRFLTPTSSYSASTGAESQTWVQKAHDTPCNVVVVSGKTAITAGDLWLPRTLSVKCRKASYINERARFRWNGDTYKIETCVCVRNAYGEMEMQITAQRVEE